MLYHLNICNANTYICTNRVNTTSMINQSRYNNIEATIIFLATNNNNNDLYTDRISIYPKKNTRQLLKFYIYIIFFSIIRQLYRFESCERNVGHVTCAFDRQPFRYYDKEKFFVQCIANIKENELVYLSNLLNPVECLQLVQAIYEVTPMKTERRVKKYETLMNKDFAGMSTLSKECLLNLEEWSQDFPSKNN